MKFVVFNVALKERLQFSYGMSNGSLQRLYQQVSLPRNRETQMRKNVHDAAWMFEKVIDANIIDERQGAMLVYLREEDKRERRIEQHLQLMRSVTRVLNVLALVESVRM